MTLPYPRIPPDIVHLGPLTLRWYGVMYVVGYAVGAAHALRFARVPAPAAEVATEPAA